MTHPIGDGLLEGLEEGRIRVAERAADGTWSVNGWVKEAILELFRDSAVVEMGPSSARELWPFVDKRALTVRQFQVEDGVRLVPGGSAVRRGAYVGEGCVLMPPCYVNIGAWVGSGTMIDSHALVGSCAQIGVRVHLSAGVQIGGVLEPVGSVPVIVEDGCMVGGQAGIYEGVLVRERAVIGAGVVLTASTRVYDLVHERELTASSGRGLEIPAGAVVVPGSRPVSSDSEFARERGLQQTCALVVKYRDEGTDAKTALEEALRSPGGE